MAQVSDGEQNVMPRGEPRILRATLGLLAVALCLEVAFVMGARASADELRAKAALLQTLGMSTLAVSSECKASRSLTEGLCACLGDVPGGYCYHTPCDIVGAPRPGPDGVYVLEIRR